MSKLALGSLVLSFLALLISVFTLISTIPCAREKSSRKEKLVFNPTSTGSFDISPYTPPTNLEIRCGTGGGLIKIYFADGRVEIADGVSLPEAAKMFWDAVGKSFPEFKRATISEYERRR